MELGKPQVVSFTTKHHFTVGQRITMDINGEHFSGVVTAVEHKADGNHVTAEDPTPVPIIESTLHAL